MKALRIFGRSVSFADEDVEAIEKAGLPFDGRFAELLLHWSGVDKEGLLLMADDEAHDTCVGAFKGYEAIVKGASKFKTDPLCIGHRERSIASL